MEDEEEFVTFGDEDPLEIGEEEFRPIGSRDNRPPPPSTFISSSSEDNDNYSSDDLRAPKKIKKTKDSGPPQPLLIRPTAVPANRPIPQSQQRPTRLSLLQPATFTFGNNNNDSNEKEPPGAPRGAPKGGKNIK